MSPPIASLRGRASESDVNLTAENVSFESRGFVQANELSDDVLWKK
jgi:hypothetical protein